MSDEEMQALPEVMSTQAEAIVERAKSLGLTWTLRPGTMATESLVVSDGDTVPVGVESLIGGLSTGQRVMMMQVPPGGNFVIGDPTNTLSKAPAMVGTLGTLATATTTPEVAVASANWASEPTFVFPPGRVFLARLTGGIYNTAGAPRVIGIRLRLGASTIVGTQLLYRPWLCDLLGGVGGSYDWTGYFKNSRTTTVSSKLTVSIQNVSTAGTVGIYGDANQPNTVVIQDLCSLADAPELASVTISV